MAFIPMPSGIHLCFDFLSDGQNWQFCVTARKTAGGAILAGDLTAAATAGANWWNNTFKPSLKGNTTCKQVRAIDETSQGAPVAFSTVGNAGTSAGGDMPINAPLVISQRTAKRGRSYRGRAYVSGLADNMASTVAYLAATGTTLVSNFNQLKTDLLASGFTLAVATKQHNKQVVNPAEMNDVIAIIVDTNIDSQRRRLAGRGT